MAFNERMIMSFPGLANYVEPVPGTDVTCYLGVWSNKPSEWIYSLWSVDWNGELVSSGSFDLTGLIVTPAQVARIAFLMDVEYGSGHAEV